MNHGLIELVSYYQNNISILRSYCHLLHFTIFKAYFRVIYISVFSDCFVAIDQHYHHY